LASHSVLIVNMSLICTPQLHIEIIINKKIVSSWLFKNC